MLAAALDAASQQQSQSREREQTRTQERAGKREIIPGSELMTPKEREDCLAPSGSHKPREM